MSLKEQTQEFLAYDFKSYLISDGLTSEQHLWATAKLSGKKSRERSLDNKGENSPLDLTMGSLIPGYSMAGWEEPSCSPSAEWLVIVCLTHMTFTVRVASIILPLPLRAWGANCKNRGLEERGFGRPWPSLRAFLQILLAYAERSPTSIVFRIPVFSKR